MTKEQLIEKYGKGIQVLDKGFVRFIDCMGDDGAIVQMARVSYGEGTKSVSDDTTLIRYLARHRHSSPTEGCVIKLHYKMPLSIAMQHVRHRTQSLNQISARYSVMKDEFYVPDLERMQYQALNNKQGSGSQLPEEEALVVITDLEHYNAQAYAMYEKLLNHHGLTRERARFVLPSNLYTEFYSVMNLHNLFHYLGLRMHPHAQYEIRVYANAVSDIVKDWVPAAHGAFEDYSLNAVTFSAQEMHVIRCSLDTFRDELIDMPAEKRIEILGNQFGINTKRERQEFLAKIKL